MTEDDLTRVREEVEALRKEQEAPDRPEDLDCLIYWATAVTKPP